MIEPARTSEAISAHVAVLRYPGAFRSTPEERGQEWTTVGTEYFSIASQHMREVLKSHSSRVTRGHFKSGGVNRRFGTDHAVFVHETAAAIERFSKGSRIQPDTWGIAEGGEHLLHQLRSDARAALLRIHQ